MRNDTAVLLATAIRLARLTPEGEHLFGRRSFLRDAFTVLTDSGRATPEEFAEFVTTATPERRTPIPS